MDTRGSSDVDKRIGNLIRTRRNMIGMTQDVLAKNLKVSFQQVQKYEKGVNRVSVSRMMQIAKALNEDMSYFTEVGKVSKDSQAYNAVAASPPAVRLMQAFMKIPEGTKRHVLIRLAELLAE